jgi:hypothetical protein
LIAVDIPQKYTDKANSVRGDLESPIPEFLDTSCDQHSVGPQVTPGRYPVVFTDRNSIQAGSDQTSQPQISFEMQGSARTRFADYTQKTSAII